MLIYLIGLIALIGGIVGAAVGLAKKKKEIWITSIAVVFLIWCGIALLQYADNKFIEKETEKNGGITPDWVW